MSQLSDEKKRSAGEIYSLSTLPMSAFLQNKTLQRVNGYCAEDKILELKFKVNAQSEEFWSCDFLREVMGC